MKTNPKYDVRAGWLRWAMALLLTALAAGCGGSGSGNGDPAAGTPTNPDAVRVVTLTSPLPNASAVALSTKKITVYFSEAMDPLTINASSFTLECPAGTPVPGMVSYLPDSNAATFTVNLPAGANLPRDTVCIATLTTAVKTLAGTALASSFSWSFNTGAALDTTLPSLTGTINANGAVNVPVNAKIGATFSEAMDPATINTSTYLLTHGGVVVPGTVRYSGVSATFVPASNLAPNTTYTVTITTGVKDVAGNALANDFVISWTTGAAPDTTPPTVIGSIHANGATNVAVNTKVGATFSEGMDPTSITTQSFSLRQTANGAAVTGVVSYSGVDAVFVPVSPLNYSTNYTVTVKGGASGVKDLAGNPLVGDFVLSWSTGVAPDTTAPTVSANTPLANATIATLNTPVTAHFSKAMDPLTITSATFRLATTLDPNTAIAGSVAYAANGNVATFTPAANFPNSRTMVATLTTEVRDAAGNALASNFSWSFNTPDPLPRTPASVNLGSAANFGVLAGTGITNTQTTTVTGDVGAPTQSVPPTLTAGYTNYQLVGDAPLVNGLAALSVGLASANSATCDVSESGGLNSFSGQTFTPGVYCYGGAITITGTLFLNGPGVYLFRSASTFDTVANTIVALGGGATTSNTTVYWVPGGATTLGALTNFTGTIMSAAAITLGGGATVQAGRVLTTAHATLSTNTIAKP